MDCWTFFEIALGFARMLNEPESNWTPERMLLLHRARSISRRPMHRRLSFAAALLGRLALRQRPPRSGGGSDARARWAQRAAFRARNERRLATLSLSCRESLIAGAACAAWKQMSLRGPFMKFRKARSPKSSRNCAAATSSESISHERSGLHSTAHVGLALRTGDGVLHFMHASSPSNYGKVVVDDAAFEISLPLPFGQRNPGRAAAALVLVEPVQLAAAIFATARRPPQHLHLALRVLP